MENSQFLTSMRLLVKVYGDKNYPEERVDILWNRFKKMSITDFSNMIKKLVASCRYAPMLDDFEKYGADQIQVMNNTIKHDRENKLKKIDCNACGSTGILTRYRIEDKNGYAFACGFCESAKTIGLNETYFPVFTEQLAKKYSK